MVTQTRDGKGRGQRHQHTPRLRDNKRVFLRNEVVLWGWNQGWAQGQEPAKDGCEVGRRKAGSAEMVALETLESIEGPLAGFKEPRSTLRFVLF